MADPLRSAMSSVTPDDTSLAVPSDNRLRTGQQRVLDQVHTIKRSKSKLTKNGSPTRAPVFSEFGSFKFSPAITNGINRSATLNHKSSSGFSKSVSAQKTRSQSTKTVKSRTLTRSGQWDQISPTALQQPPNGLKPSRSEPRATGQAVQTQQANRQQSNRYSLHSVTSNNVQTTSTNSIGRMVRKASTQSESKGSLIKAVKTEQEQSVNLTLKEAVEFLSHTNESFQLCGASFIQHSTFKEESSKQEVLTLGGIPVLVGLLQSPNPEVSQSASAALRNLVFKDQENKQEVLRVGGIDNALELLKETDSTETQRQLTGLLWNLSSSDDLKGELIASALPVLNSSVVVPFTCWSDSSANNNIHPDVFYSATGCLRYIQSCVAEDNPDDKSVENCACILHNLTYQLETESPECFSKFSPPAEAPGAKKNTTVGCFSPKSIKLHKENVFDMNKSLKDDPVPSGVNWLCHPKAMQVYLSLLGTSQKDATMEACCGALQNLTANKGPGSSAISQILVQKLGAMSTITPLLRSPNQTLQKTAMCLMGNMSRSGTLQSSIAKQVLPDLASLLSSGTRDMGNSDDTVATACNNMRGLLLADSDVGKKVLTSELVTSLADLSENTSLPKGSKAASLLLYSLWNEKSLQATLKKLGLGKSLFVNDVTTAAHKSVQVIE
ncbi:hypothetical protein NHX12_013481 [Muraenolepis orangiensis]|uniref:Plakophilin 1 n=1 Tax=Muraenolepis orangiensis TaxID=630683 RepID=A0A9Q0DEY0_9TELE|nr:hypothetical protein NHX12_013481 [Muraenolepis orangiensis]